MSDIGPLNVTVTGVAVPQWFPTTLMGSPSGSTDTTSTLNEAVATAVSVEKFTVPITGLTCDRENVV